MNEIILWIEDCMNLFMQMILIFMVQKYVFLERGLQGKRRVHYFCIGYALVLLLNFFIGEEAATLLIVIAAGMHISLGRSHKRLLGALVVFPAMGIVNGIVNPLLIIPVSMIGFSKLGEAIYNVALLILLLLLLVFWLKGKNWRRNFEFEMQYRHVHKLERVLLWITGLLMLVVSNFFVEPAAMISDDNSAHIWFNTAKFIIGLTEFFLTIVIIVLVMEGNKRCYYYEKTERLSLQMVHALAHTIDAKDSYTNGHSTRVAQYAVMLAKRMGYEGKALKRLQYAALLHDIGKIGIPGEIINKTSKLTDEEYEVIKTHPAIGSNILEEISEMPDIATGARWHHERYDGKGYPDGLAGENIPEIARIIGVADAYDAMTSKRSYRDVLPQEKVLGEIERGKGTQFDPEIAELMEELMKEDTLYKMHE